MTPRFSFSTTLRGKTLLIIGGTLLVLTIVLYLPLRHVLLDSFAALEEQLTVQHTQRAVNALAAVQAKLGTTTESYATWDDTYAFVESRDDEYLAVNFAEVTFGIEQIDLVAVYDSAGRFIAGRRIDPELGVVETLPPAFHQLSARSPLLAPPLQKPDALGILLLPDGPLLVAARPIVTSAGEGPARGTLIMARALDTATVEQIATTIELPLTIVPLSDGAGADMQAVRDALLAGAPVVVRPLSPTLIGGYALLRDIYGEPSLSLHVESPRTVYTQGQASTNYLMLALLVVGLIFCITMLLLFERVVLSRLAMLDLQVRQVGLHSTDGARVSIPGRDELGRLSVTINTMLQAIEQTQAEHQRAEAARAQLQEELVRAKEQLTHMVVHDLKNPLTAVDGYLHMLRLTAHDAEQRQLVAGARRSANTMMDLVNNILDVARLAEGRLQVHLDATNLTALLASCVDELALWAQQEAKLVRLCVAPDLPLVTIDASLVRRIVINLLSNAIKHTQSDTTIVVGASVDDEGVRLWVTDNGPGLSAEQQRGLFDRFVSPSANIGRQTNTGLGLAFCKLAVEAHQGQLLVTSTPGIGTTFTVVLPPSLIVDIAHETSVGSRM